MSKMNFYSTVVPSYIRKFPYQTVYQLNCTKKLYHWLPPCVHVVIVHFASELKGTNPNLVIVLPNHIHLCWKPVGHPSLHTCIHGNFACDLSVWDKIKTHFKMDCLTPIFKLSVERRTSHGPTIWWLSMCQLTSWISVAKNPWTWIL